MYHPCMVTTSTHEFTHYPSSLCNKDLFHCVLDRMRGGNQYVRQ